jgi:hypothetical protein
MYEIFPWQEIHTILCNQNHEQIDDISIHHTHQIHKTRIPHEAGVSVEESEAQDAHQRETRHRCQHLEGILIESVCLIEDPIHHEPTEHHDATVNKEDAPIWQ